MAILRYTIAVCIFIVDWSMYAFYKFKWMFMRMQFMKKIQKNKVKYLTEKTQWIAEEEVI